MIFKKITIENFKSIGENQVIVDFSFNGTKLLLGRNGAGKTTIFDAIIWCIYGVTRLKADNVVNKKIGSNTKVELYFSEDNNDYVITRYRKHSVHKNNIYVFKNGENITLKNPTDNQEMINEIVGIDSRAFSSSIILSSETYKQFMRETNAVRLQIFESVFSLRDINNFSKANKLIEKGIDSKISQKKSDAQSLQSFVQADKEVMKKYKENYDKLVANIDSQIDEHNKNIEKLILEKSELSEIDFDAEMKAAVAYKVALLNHEEAVKKIESLNEMCKSYISQKLGYEKTLDSYRNVISTHSVEELKNEMKLISDKRVQDEAINTINKQLSEIANDVRLKKSLKSTDDKKILEVESQLSIINNKISEINSSRCPTCGQHIESEKSATLLKELNAELSEKTESINSLKISSSNYQKEIDDLKNKEFRLNTELSSIEIISPKYDTGDIRAIANQLKEASENIHQVENQVASISSSISSLQKQVSDAERELSDNYDSAKISHTAEELDEMKAKFSNISAMIESEKKAIENAKLTKKTAFDSEYVSKTISAIKERVTSINLIETEIKSLSKDLAEYSILDDVFSNGENGFKKYFINKTISAFNEKLNTFLPFFFDDQIEIIFDKDLNDTITFRGANTDFEELSSGEKTRCELCVVFAMFFMVRVLFGSGTNLLCIDEIIDHGLDDYGVKASKQILDDISKNNAVFVVTHRDDLKELFNDSITVYKDGDGFTKIKE